MSSRLLSVLRSSTHKDASVTHRVTEKPLQRAEFIIEDHRFSTYVAEGTSVNKALDQAIQEAGGKVLDLYYDKYQTSEKVAIILPDGTIVACDDFTKIEKATQGQDLSQFGSSILDRLRSASEQSKGGLHYGAGDSKSVHIIVKGEQVELPNGDRIQINGGNRIISVYVTDSVFDPKVMDDFRDRYKNQVDLYRRPEAQLVRKVVAAHGDDRTKDVLLDNTFQKEARIVVMDTYTGAIQTPEEYVGQIENARLTVPFEYSPLDNVISIQPVRENWSVKGVLPIPQNDNAKEGQAALRLLNSNLIVTEDSVYTIESIGRPNLVVVRNVSRLETNAVNALDERVDLNNGLKQTELGLDRSTSQVDIEKSQINKVQTYEHEKKIEIKKIDSKKHETNAGQNRSTLGKFPICDIISNNAKTGQILKTRNYPVIDLETLKLVNIRQKIRKEVIINKEKILRSKKKELDKHSSKHESKKKKSTKQMPKQVKTEQKNSVITRQKKKLKKDNNKSFEALRTTIKIQKIIKQKSITNSKHKQPVLKEVVKNNKEFKVRSQLIKQIIVTPKIQLKESKETKIKTIEKQEVQLTKRPRKKLSQRNLHQMLGGLFRKRPRMRRSISADAEAA